jgi:hypothetical protein
MADLFLQKCEKQEKDLFLVSQPDKRLFVSKEQRKK